MSGWGEKDIIKVDTRTSDRFGSWESQHWAERMPDEGEIYIAVQTWESGKFIKAKSRTCT